LHTPINRKTPILQDAEAHERPTSTKPRAVFPKKQSHETVKNDDQNASTDQPQTAKIAGTLGRANGTQAQNRARCSPPKTVSGNSQK
jgi:hypothetical protein